MTLRLDLRRPCYQPHRLTAVGFFYGVFERFDMLADNDSSKQNAKATPSLSGAIDMLSRCMYVVATISESRVGVQRQLLGEVDATLGNERALGSKAAMSGQINEIYDLASALLDRLRDEQVAIAELEGKLFAPEIADQGVPFVSADHGQVCCEGGVALNLSGLSRGREVSLDSLIKRRD